MSLVIFSRWTIFIVCVPVIHISNTFINRPNSFAADLVHVALVDGSLIKCMYYICFPVFGWTIAPIISCLLWHRIFCRAAPSLYVSVFTRDMTAIDWWHVGYMCMGSSHSFSIRLSLILSALYEVISLVGTLVYVPSNKCASIAFLNISANVSNYLNLQFQVTGRVTPASRVQF